MSEYDYKFTTDEVKSYLPEGYEGNVFRLTYTWIPVIPITDEKPMILEIGSYHGANLCSFMKTYAKHPETEIHCVDPWKDYHGYPEYQTVQPTNYSLFLKNISKLSPSDINKIHLHRGLSEDIVPTFTNESFDIIYVDGNHETKYVVEDALLCFKKLKPNGWIIFDDLQAPEVQHGTSIFHHLCHTHFSNIISHNGQLFMKRKSE